MQRGDPVELNFESLEMKHQWIELKEYTRKMSHLSGHHVYFHSYGLSNVTNSYFFVFSADNSKKFITVWEIYLSAQGR